MDNLNKEVKEKVKEVRSRMFGYVGASLGLVAGLAWNEAISSLINDLLPLSKNSLTAKFIYAIVVTVVVVQLIRYFERHLSKE